MVLKDAVDWHNEGIDLHRSGNYEKAVQCYDRALEIDPKGADVWNNKGVALKNLGHYDEAVQCYDRALEVDPKYARAWLNKSVALGNLGRYGKAVQCYDRALEVDPKDADAWYSKGVALDALGRYDEAVPCYDRALEIDPKYASHRVIGDLRLQHRALEVGPKYARAWYNRGVALKNLGHYDEAVQCYDRALEVDPEDARAWYSKGVALGNLGRYNEAIQCFDHVLEIDPKNPYAWHNKGFALKNLSRYDEAIQCFDRALEIDPEDAFAWNNKGVALDDLGRYDEAIQCYDHALEIDPEYTLAKDNRDKALSKTVDTITSASPRPDRAGKLPQSPAHPVEPIKTSSSLTIERTIYDPLTRDFTISSSRPLVNVRDWINRHNPSSYWLVICVHNHSNHPIDEWGIELESSSTLQILETVIEGSGGQVRLQVSNPKPWLQLSTFGVPHNRGIVIPRGGSRRIYFRLGSESCGVSHSIKGRFIASDAEVEIREKQFQHSCDVATLGVAIRQSPERALQFTKNALTQRYDPKTVLSCLHTFHLIQEIDTCCRMKRFEDVHDKLYVLEDALGKMGLSERLVGLVKQLNALDIDDGMGGSMLELKAQRAEKMCKNIVDVWTTEVLLVPRC